MWNTRFLAPVLILSLASCASDHRPVLLAEAQLGKSPGIVPRSSAISERDLLDFNILQRTCAVYVALRSSAWKSPIAFGSDMDDSMVHWNLCPGGKKVACKVTTTADGETIITGIDWPHGDATAAANEGHQSTASY